MDQHRSRKENRQEGRKKGKDNEGRNEVSEKRSTEGSSLLKSTWKCVEISGKAGK